RDICDKHVLLLVYDASLLQDNLHFIKQREASCQDKTIREITREIADQCDILYFSARKLGSARGGGIITNSEDVYMQLREYITLYEGFLSYCGLFVREMKALTFDIEVTLDEDVISRGSNFINYMTEQLIERGVPVVTPAGGLGCHINAKDFVDHLPQSEYPAGALAAAFYIVSGVRGMERGTMSEQRQEDEQRL